MPRSPGAVLQCVQPQYVSSAAFGGRGCRRRRSNVSGRAPPARGGGQGAGASAVARGIPLPRRLPQAFSNGQSIVLEYNTVD